MAGVLPSLPPPPSPPLLPPLLTSPQHTPPSFHHTLSQGVSWGCRPSLLPRPPPSHSPPRLFQSSLFCSKTFPDASYCACARTRRCENQTVKFGREVAEILYGFSCTYRYLGARFIVTRFWTPKIELIGGLNYKAGYFHYSLIPIWTRTILNK